jgi:UDP-N-acetylmuramoyl-L-alanine---L-glutamate ligase
MSDVVASLKEKNIMILGFAREGVSTYRFLRNYYKNKKLLICDRAKLNELDGVRKKIIESDIAVEYVGGKNYLKTLKSVQVVIKSPGIPNKLTEIVEAKKRGVEFLSQTQLFFELCPGRMIGVTGTKGKSTTTSLIYHILKHAKIPAVLLGNIGKPPLDHLKDGNKNTWFVVELSSHQLSDINKSPHIAVLLNIFKEHLDYYRNFEEYLAAKENIARFQKTGDVFIFNKQAPEFADIAKTTMANKLTFSHDVTMGANCYPLKGYILLNEEKGSRKVLKIDEIPLLGSHNVANCMAAILASRSVGASVKDIRDATKTFKPLKTRLETVGTYRGITFVCDTLATIPEATIAAIDAFNGRVGTLICGGFDRGQDYRKLAEKIVEERIDNLALFPTTGERIIVNVREIAKKIETNVIKTDSMEEAVKFAYKNTPQGKICLLSAASPSFSVFKDYEDEASQFRLQVSSLAKLKI